MASAVDICNIGLSMLGAEAQVASINPPDGSVEAGYCARFYPLARKELLEDHAWSFAKKRVELAEVTNDSTVWDYAYALPSDCLKSLRVLSLQTIVDAAGFYPAGVYNVDRMVVDEVFTERGSVLFDIEGAVLRPNEPEAMLLYTSDVTDTTKFTAKVVTAFGMLMASYLAGPIIKGPEGARTAVQWRQAAMNAIATAAASDANASHETASHAAAHMRVRA